MVHLQQQRNDNIIIIRVLQNVYPVQKTQMHCDKKQHNNVDEYI